MKNSDRIWRWSSFVIVKLSGSGFAIALLALYILHSSSYDLYTFSEYLSSPFLWIVFYAYGIICSFLIDFLAYCFPKVISKLKFILYILAGFAIFMFQGNAMIAIIAGIVGALCALLFYVGTMMSHRNRLFKYGFAFMIPLVILILLSFDFTEKRNWNETRTDSTYEASFAYFNGKHEIPIEVGKGETFTFRIVVKNDNGGGHGYHVRTDDQSMVPMGKPGADKYSIHSEEGGTYQIVVTGDQLKGSIQVDWEVTDEM